jgi:hypothetical protein
VRKEASKELVGERVAFGETVDESDQSRAAARKIGATLHGPGHYEAIDWGPTRALKHALPDYRQKADSGKA